jgi:NADH dehydrogenase/putative oxidoreductase
MVSYDGVNRRRLGAGVVWINRTLRIINGTAPVVDLAIRLWLAQLFWVSGVVGVLDWRAALSQTPWLAAALSMHPYQLAIALTALRLALSPLLLVGLATRLAATPIFLLSLAAYRANPGQDAPLLWALLGGWYLLVGPGPISFDHVIARGIYRSALPLAPVAGRILARLGSTTRPVGLAILRVGLAAVLLRHGMVSFHGGFALGALLAAGLATRVAALPLLAATGGATMHAVSNEHVCWTLLLLLIIACGPGPLSLDALIGTAWRRLAPAWSGSSAKIAPALPRVVIVGGGFAGIAAARALRDTQCDVVLIDQHNYHLFQPLLYQVATASLSPADIATPIRALFRGQPNVSVVLGEVTAIDAKHRLVVTRHGATIPYDTLILATGARHAYFGHDDWEDAAPGLKTLDDATSLRRRLLLAFERAEIETDPAARKALLTFVVIGGGPTGVELAGAIAELARHGLTREFRAIDPAQARVMLIQSGDRLLPAFPASLSRAATRALRNLGVEVCVGNAVDGVDEHGVTLGGQRIACATSFWAAGVAASPAAAWLKAAADRAGRLLVAPDLTVPGCPDIFAVGDTAAVNAWNGQPVPGLAPAAKQAGEYAARVIRARLAGRHAPKPFRYHHSGSLATIGRREAVADFGRVKIDGSLAWWIWGMVHILFLAGTRNRLVVGVQWFWAYLTFGRGIRLITGDARR